MLDDQLARSEYMAGDYSIADIATYPWISAGFGVVKSAKPEIVGEGANVARWIGAIADRPAVKKGMAVPQL